MKLLKKKAAAEGEGLINLVRNAELSRSEVQKLIDLLLNKQQDNPTFVDDDWTEVYLFIHETNNF